MTIALMNLPRKIDYPIYELRVDGGSHYWRVYQRYTSSSNISSTPLLRTVRTHPSLNLIGRGWRGNAISLCERFSVIRSNDY